MIFMMNDIFSKFKCNIFDKHVGRKLADLYFLTIGDLNLFFLATTRDHQIHRCIVVDNDGGQDDGETVVNSQRTVKDRSRSETHTVAKSLFEIGHDVNANRMG